jgi:hypothetical protein
MAISRYHLPPEQARQTIGEDLYNWMLELHRAVWGEFGGTGTGILNGENIVPVEDLVTDATDTDQGLKPDGIGGLEFGPVGALDAAYVVLALDADLTAERLLTGGTNITITDGGAGGNVTVDVSPQGSGSGLDADTVDAVEESTWSYVDGSRAFTGTVGGIDPVADTDLATKSYVDSTVSGVAETVIGEEVSGTKDGANQTFTVTILPAANNLVGVYHNGLRLTRVTAAPANHGEFRVQGVTIDVFTAPAATDYVVADYVKEPGAATIIGEEPAGTKDGANVTFTLASTPEITNNPGVYLNGFRLTPVSGTPGSTEYSRSGGTLTLGLAPAATDYMVAAYSTGVGP